MIKAGDETNFDWVGAHQENDWDCLRGSFRGKHRWGPARRCDHRNRTANQFGGKRRQPIIMAFRPAVFNRHITALNITGFGQASVKSTNSLAPRHKRFAIEKPDHRQRKLLRASGRRPCNCRAAECRDELPPPHGDGENDGYRAPEATFLVVAMICPPVRYSTLNWLRRTLRMSVRGGVDRSAPGDRQGVDGASPSR